MTVHSRIDQALVIPLLSLYRCDAPDQEAFLRELRRQLAAASTYQLERGLERIVRTHRYKTLPSVAEIVEAVEASPTAPPAPTGASVAPARSVYGNRPPILVRAERALAEWEHATQVDCAIVEASRPGFIHACRRVVEVWSQPDDGRRSADEADRADAIVRAIYR